MIFSLYLINLLANLTNILMVIWTLSFVTIGLLFISSIVEDIEEEKKQEYLNYIKKIVVYIILGVGVTIAVIPSEKTMYLMLSTQIIQNINNNEKVSILGEKTIKLLEGKIDDLLEKKK